MSKDRSEKKTLGISVKKSGDFSEWYQQVITKADLADYTAVSGCIVFKPTSYAIWEKIQSTLDNRFKKFGVKNAYFPLFIPESLLKKESEHVEGFVPEVAWVTQSGQEKLAERLAVRPTSETIIYDSYSKWIRSWRDLPLLLNQWCNVVRWEFKNPRPFIRTREFLWQEGHTVHETVEEADEMVMNMLEQYRQVAEDYLAIPVLIGKKSEKEKFAGAVYTTTIEALMPDGKALQMATSHNLGQNFAKAFDINFLGKDNKKQTPWQTSWGMSTRVIGSVIMAHGDDYGLVLPPKIAPVQVIIVPILFEDSGKEVLAEASKIQKDLEKKGITTEVDSRDSYSPGWKFNESELKGIPVRIEIGPRDLKKKEAVVFRRDTRQKSTVKIKNIASDVEKTLDAIQDSLYKRAKKHLDSNIVPVKDLSDITKAAKDKKLGKGFFCGSVKCEETLKDKSDGSSSRCMTLNDKEKKGKCAVCSKEGIITWFGKAY